MEMNVQLIIVTPPVDVKLPHLFVTITMNVPMIAVYPPPVAITLRQTAMMTIFAQQIPVALFQVVYTQPLFVSQTEIAQPKLVILPSDVKRRTSVATIVMPVLMMVATPILVAGIQT